MSFDSFVLGPIALLLATPLIAAQSAANLVINGDFENHIGTGCQYNLTNGLLAAMLPDATAYGGSNEIDLMTGMCYGAPMIGTTKLGIVAHAGGVRDELTLSLSSPVVAGSAYSISLWVYPEVSFLSTVGQVEIGLTSSATSFGTLVFTIPAQAPSTWTQVGLVFTAPVNATHLSVSGGQLSGWTHIDGVELIPAGCFPVPVTYCTPKTNSIGCLPSMSTTGCSSATNAFPFLVLASQVRNQKVGLLLYGATGRAAVPFTGGFLCVNSPVKRSIGAASGGTSLPASDCSGVYSLDMNAFAAGALGGNPLPALAVQGTTVDCQWWGRDPGFPAPANTTLSNALEYVVGS